MKDKKKIIIGTLCALIMIMAVGYALLSQQLSINGSASITSNWQVEITNITEKEKSTGTTTNSTNYTATTASFNTSLTSPGDYAIYEVTVTNKGTLDAVLSAEPTVTTGNNEAIQYELEGIKRGDKILKNNQTDTFTIKVTYNSATTTQPTTLTSNIEVTLNYEQDLGQVVVYDEYAIGDVISFAGSDWYVIKSSTEEEDYVTLLKKNVLTNSELGIYSSNSSDDTMKFYTDVDTCYVDNNVSPSRHVTTGCNNDYNNSMIKEMLEQQYMSTIGEQNLKKIDNYKIRLLKLDELVTNLGYSLNNYGTGYIYGGSNTPSWLYHDIHTYWTMTPYIDNSIGVWAVSDLYWNGSSIEQSGVYYDNSVRPVINLLKSSIE